MTATGHTAGVLPAATETVDTQTAPCVPPVLAAARRIPGISVLVAAFTWSQGTTDTEDRRVLALRAVAKHDAPAQVPRRICVNCSFPSPSPVWPGGRLLTAPW